MVVAVRAVRVVEMLADEIVDVIAVGNLLVTAIGAVNVSGLVLAAGMLGCAVHRVGFADLQDVLIHVVMVRVVEMPVVQVVEVVPMRDRRVPASGSMLVRVLCVDGVL